MIFNGIMTSEIYKARNSRDPEARLMGTCSRWAFETFLKLLRVLYTLFTVRVDDKEGQY